MSPEKVPRPTAAQSVTYKYEVACDSMFVILNSWEGNENCEMFLKCGPQGSCSAAIMNALSILFSYARRSGVPLSVIARLFTRHGGLCSKAESGRKTCIAALGELLDGLAGENEDVNDEIPKEMDGKLRTRHTGCGPMKLFFGEESDNSLRYVDVRLAQTNTCAHTITSVVSDLISLMLGYGVEPEQIVKGLGDIMCPVARQDSKSCMDGIASAIANHVRVDAKKKKVA